MQKRRRHLEQRLEHRVRLDQRGDGVDQLPVARVRGYLGSVGPLSPQLRDWSVTELLALLPDELRREDQEEEEEEGGEENEGM